MNSHRLYFLFHVAAAALLFLIVVVLKGRIQAQTFDSPPIRFPSTAQEGHLDTSPRPNSFDVVISYYKEDILYLYECVETFKKHPRIAAVNPDFRLILYVKSNVTEKSLSFIQDITEADEVIQLENVGREGHTYLHHIITHYDNLADHTLFMQAEPVDWIDGPTNSTRLHPDPSVRLAHFTRNTGWMPFFHVFPRRWTDDEGGDFPYLRDIFVLARGYFPVTQTAMVSWTGQFIVSRKRIRRTEKRVYEYLRSLLAVPEDHIVHTEFHSFRSEILSVPTDPIFGHTVERAYGILFDCWDPKMAVRCWRDSREGCQCLDAPDRSAWVKKSLFSE